MGTNTKNFGVLSTITPKKKVVFTHCTLHTIFFFFGAIMDTKKHELKVLSQTDNISKQQRISQSNTNAKNKIQIPRDSSKNALLLTQSNKKIKIPYKYSTKNNNIGKNVISSNIKKPQIDSNTSARLNNELKAKPGIYHVIIHIYIYHVILHIYL